MKKVTKAILTKVNPSEQSKKGGTYIRTFWVDYYDNTKYILDVYLDHPRSKRFQPYLKTQNILGNLNILQFGKRLFIDGNSDFNFIGNKSK